MASMSATATSAHQLRLEPEADASGFERRLDDLHQMLYRRGGIRPVNAALEELAKLLLLQFHHSREPTWYVEGCGPIAQVLDPKRLLKTGDVASVKQAFQQVASLPAFAGRLPGGGLQPIWPSDEPLRIERADVLAEALGVMSPSMIETSSVSGFDMLGTAFDVFLRGRYDHAGGLATYLTPHNVAAMLARMALADLDILEHDVGEPLIGDPCCGTGRFLIAALHEILKGEAETAEDSDRSPRLRSFLENGLFGADQSSSSVAKARINLLLFGARHPFVFRVQDSITDAHIDALRGRLRIVLTNPPFGDRKYDSADGIERTVRVLPTLRRRPQIDPALAFVARCLDLLGDDGRLGIVLPDGLVDSRVLRDALLREGETRIKDVSVEANVSLPTATFALSGTVAKTSAVLIRKGGTSRATVFLARADHVGYLKQAGAAVLDPAGDDLPMIATAGVAALRIERVPAATRDSVTFISEDPLAAVVRREDVQTIDPARLDPAAFGARRELRMHGGQKLSELVSPVRRRGNRSIAGVPFVSVLHIDDLGAVAWRKARAYSPSTPGQLVEPGEILFSLLNPRHMRATVIPEASGQVLCSAEFGVFKSVGDPYEILALLHDPRVRAQLAPLGRGTSSSRRRIETEDFLDIYVPRVDPAILEQSAARLRASLETLAAVADAAAGAYAEVVEAGRSVAKPHLVLPEGSSV